ncbi:MAG: LytTR family DNA-binding domain-containing protein [Clostridia bacterium]|nr:LytTR family DNA-binding domain-containing protein [Clostridia bacterium]
MKIAICDDEELVRKEFRKRIHDYLEGKNISCEIAEFSTGGEFVALSGGLDLVFMDYLLPDGNGIDFIKQIRQNNSRLSVAFLTAYSEHAPEAYTTDAFRYLVKPVRDELLFEALDVFVGVYESTRRIVVPTKDKTFFLDPDEVMYLEAEGRNTVIRTATGHYSSPKGINVFNAEISNPRFFRTHRSFILNMKYVSSIDKKTVTLVNGEKVLCSSIVRDEFMKNYMSYLKYEA